MKKIIITALAACFVTYQGALFAQISGELEISPVIVNPKEQKLLRYEEFNFYPREKPSVSLFLRGEIGPIYFNARGKDIGENDTDSSFFGNYKSVLITDSSYIKTLHNIDTGKNTKRAKNDFKSTVFPLSNLSLFAALAEEDKTGYLKSGLPVGQKLEEQSLGIQGIYKFLNGSLVYKKDEFNEYWSGHDKKDLNFKINITLNQKHNFNLSYSDGEITPKNAAYALTNKIDFKTVNLSSDFEISKNIGIWAFYLKNERKNKNQSNFSEENKSILVGLNVYLKKLNLSFNYEDTNKEFTGTSIKEQDTKAFEVEADTVISYVKLRGQYKNGEKEVTGVLSSNLTNFIELPSDFKTYSTSISANPISKLGITYYLKRSEDKNKLATTYGLIKSKNYQESGSIYYLLSGKATLNYNYATNEIWTQASYYYFANPQVDGIQEVKEDSVFHSIGIDYELKDGALVNVYYNQTDSDVKEPVLSNRIDERNLSLELNKKVQDIELKAILKKNLYEDKAEDDYKDGKLIEIQVKKQI